MDDWENPENLDLWKKVVLNHNLCKLFPYTRLTGVGIYDFEPEPLRHGIGSGIWTIVFKCDISGPSVQNFVFWIYIV